VDKLTNNCFYYYRQILNYYFIFCQLKNFNMSPMPLYYGVLGINYLKGAMYVDWVPNYCRNSVHIY